MLNYFIVGIVVIILQGLVLLAHWFFYLTVLRFLGISNPTIILALKISLGILAFTFIPASLLAFLTDNILVRIFYTLAAWWLGTFMYLLISACLLRLVDALAGAASLTLNTKLLAGFLFILAVAISVYGTINASSVRITRLNIRLPNLPPSWQGKTALWTSDIHLGEVRNIEFANEVANKIRQLRPDIIFIGGDLYDGTAVNLSEVTAPFSNLDAPMGTYFITGNHEEFDGLEKYLNAVRQNGIRVLNNELININGLQIIGVDYRDASDSQNFKTILQKIGLNRSQPSILLKHAPTDIPIAEQFGISFQISGHAHAGQIWPVNYISNLVYRGYIYGLKQSGNMQIYTSSGTGTWGPPLRVGTIPEIVLINFL